MHGDAALFHAVGDYLGARPGWRYESSTTPGADPSWCLDVGGEIRCGVTVLDGSICVYRPEQDSELMLGDLAALSGWLTVHEDSLRSR